MVWGNSKKDFDLIYERTFALLIRVLVRMMGSAEIAEDICQETFVKFHQRTQGFPSAEEAKFWLLRVAKNLALNYEKRKTRERKAYKKVLSDGEGRSTESGEDEYFKKETSLRVREALLLLPGKLREVLVLKEYGDLSYKEIAAILKISEGNVKVRVFRAREWLAAFFQNSEEMHVP
ncbi:MAG: RNA polymerase sigma factor [Spirochaetales bacterium]|jgi:RNA polymerase sigma-70 factor (ECF subfamily)|nr:RNA polymerase sigma factor [Spirochaetales bacterium]